MCPFPLNRKKFGYSGVRDARHARNLCVFVFMSGFAATNVQGGEDPQDVSSCSLFSAKEPLVIGLFYGKRPLKRSHPMRLCHPVFAFMSGFAATNVTLSPEPQTFLGLRGIQGCCGLKCLGYIGSRSCRTYIFEYVYIAFFRTT